MSTLYGATDDFFLIQHVACCAKHGLQRHSVSRASAGTLRLKKWAMALSKV